MTFVDSSIWISYLRHGEPSIVKPLELLLDQDEVALSAVVHLELLSGAAQKSLGVLARLLQAIPVYYPSKDTFRLAESWVQKGRRAGNLFGAMDLVIAATAAERGGTIWSADGDFVRMARLGWVKLFRDTSPQG